MTLRAFAQTYADGASVVAVMTKVLAQVDPADPVWISCVSAATILARARELDALDDAQRAALPLFGVPFAVKDNIDVRGVPTTAACPEFAYRPERSATVVERLQAAGAIVVGKTNLDQFATGLVGTRSPYGVPVNPFDAAYIPGGSSSGSAVAVARNIVPFALGTDTAGSGRVPAGINGLVGLKPTRGVVSTAGVVPACRSLDCVSIFAHTIEDAVAVLAVAAAPDPRDAFSRATHDRATPLGGAFRFAVPMPEQCEFFGDDVARGAFADSVARYESAGGTAVAVDLGDCFEAAALLYDGPFVAERTAAVGAFARAHPDALLEVTRTIVAGGERFRAADAFEAMYRVRDLRARTAHIFDDTAFLLVPTAPTSYRLDEIAAEPYALNARLGTYTNFVNLLDWCALAIPSSHYPDGRPIGVTLIGPAFTDSRLAEAGSRFAAAVAPASR